MTHIKEIQVVNIYKYIDDTIAAYVQHPDLKEMVEAPQLKDLEIMIDAMFKAEHIPALQEALDRVKIVYALSIGQKKQDEIMWHPV